LRQARPRAVLRQRRAPSGFRPRRNERRVRVRKDVPNEIAVATLSIEAATMALESLFERMNALPRADKVMVSDTVHQALARLQAAKDLLEQLQDLPPGRVGP
jgi:hypothetical protein